MIAEPIQSLDSLLCIVAIIIVYKSKTLHRKDKWTEWMERQHSYHKHIFVSHIMSFFEVMILFKTIGFYKIFMAHSIHNCQLVWNKPTNIFVSKVNVSVPSFCVTTTGPSSHNQLRQVLLSRAIYQPRMTLCCSTGIACWTNLYRLEYWHHNTTCRCTAIACWTMQICTYSSTGIKLHYADTGCTAVGCCTQRLTLTGIKEHSTMRTVYLWALAGPVSGQVDALDGAKVPKEFT